MQQGLWQAGGKVRGWVVAAWHCGGLSGTSECLAGHSLSPERGRWVTPMRQACSTGERRAYGARCGLDTLHRRCVWEYVTLLYVVSERRNMAGAQIPEPKHTVRRGKQERENTKQQKAISRCRDVMRVCVNAAAEPSQSLCIFTDPVRASLSDVLLFWPHFLSWQPSNINTIHMRLCQLKATQFSLLTWRPVPPPPPPPTDAGSKTRSIW